MKSPNGNINKGKEQGPEEETRKSGERETKAGHGERIQEAQGWVDPKRKKILKSFAMRVTVNRGNYYREIL